MLTKCKTVACYLNDRLHEKSTYMFWLASIGSVAGLATPFSYIGFGLLVVAGLVPDTRPPVDPNRN